MGGDGRRWPLAEATRVGDMLRVYLLPASERIVLAGSIRRQKPDVGDIELLAIPKEPLFDSLCQRLLEDEVCALRPDVNGRTTYGAKNKLLVHLETGIPVDIFTAPERYWGMSLVVRTGPKEFNVRMMARFKMLGMAGHAYGGVSDTTGHEQDCPDEETVFKLLGWRYVAPEVRR